MPAALAREQLSAALQSLPGWRLHQQALCCAWRFPDFTAAMAFLADCVPDIERLNHHPEWSNCYDRVQVRLTTHDAGSQVTALDVALAKLLQWRALASGATPLAQPDASAD